MMIKYADTDNNIFAPTVVETLGVFNSSALLLLKMILARRISDFFGNVKQTSFLIQRLSVTLQHFKFFNILLHSLPATDCMD